MTVQQQYVGRRVAGREVPTAASPTPATAVGLAARALVEAQVEAPVEARVDAHPTATATLDRTTSFADDATRSMPLLRTEQVSRVTVTPGKRKAVKHAGARGPLFKGLPSAPVLVGIAALAVSAGGAVAAGSSSGLADADTRLAQAGVLSGASAGSAVAVLPDRGAIISRDSRRDALEDATDAQLVAAAEKQNRQRNAALAQFAKQAEQQAAKIELNRWVLPLAGYRITATFGEYGLWSSYHTGLDFAADSGTPIVSVANGVVTETGYDGAYGNKTVVTLEDGTEIWFCHQTTIEVSPGDVVRAGERIGTVGSTGNVTGPHLHLEVRPGGGDPVDPFSALQVHGVTP